MQSRQQGFGDIRRIYAISAAQCRAARALLNWPRARLAKAASVGERTIADFESGSREPIRATVAAIRSALESAGIEFLAGNGLRLSGEAEQEPGGSTPGSTRKPAARAKTAPRAKKPGKNASAPKAKALPMSKEAQIRALREQEAG
jgi:transcriptional regulator with XRE-family HTH domain